MGDNYQEAILDHYQGFDVIKDCFAINRIQCRIGELSGPAAFNEGPRKQMQEKYNELNLILAKYPNAITITDDKIIAKIS